MARTWVKGYTKKDGTKVPGHYRDSSAKKMISAKDQYGSKVDVFEIRGNMARTSKGMYHVTKLFRKGKALKGR